MNESNQDAGAAPGENRERRLFEEAITLAGAERAAFVSGACHGDPALRRRLDAKLAAYQEPDTSQAPSLQSQTQSNSAPAFGDSVETRPHIGSIVEETAGQTFGRYRLLEKLGEGGFGSVWLAEQKEPVRRKVALKLLKLGMTDRQMLARFEAERQAQAMMDHPNIAKVLDGGVTGAPSPERGGRHSDRTSFVWDQGALMDPAALGVGRPYFVMELVRGIRITDYCDQAGLGTRERLELFIQVCQAVQHAHQKGIIHRDIKPSNVLVTLHDGVAVPKVIDFGIAKATQGDLTDKTIHTQFHQFIGTPAYVSPEQAEMSGLDIDTRADIYSLGVLLYELLTGETPFNAKDLLAQGMDAMRKAIRELEPPRPSTRLTQKLGAESASARLSQVAKPATEEQLRADSRRLLRLKETVASLRGDLDWIVMKCLEKDRSRRYETANGLASDLRRHLDDEPVLARPPSAAYRFRKAWRRHAIVFSAGAAVAVALLLGMVLSTWQAVRATRAERAQARLRLEAESATSRAQAEAERAEAGERAARAAADSLRRRSYATDMKAAQIAIAQNSRGQAARLLAAYLPKPSEEDLRGVEWRYLWRELRGDEVTTWNLGDGLVCWVRCTPDGRHVLSATMNRRLKVHDGETGRVLKELDVVCEDNGSKPAMSDNGRFVSYLTDGVLSVFEGPEWELAKRIQVPEAKGLFCPTALSPDAHSLAMNLPSGIRILDTSTWSPRSLALRARDYFDAMQFSGDGRFLLTGSDVPGSFRIHDLQTGRALPLDKPYPKVGIFHLGPDDKGLLDLDPAGKTVAWRRFDTLEPIWVHTNHQGAPMLSATFAKDGRVVALSSFDQTIQLFRVSDGVFLGRLRGHQNEVWDVHSSPDGGALFSASKDGTIKRWRWTPPPDHRRRMASNEMTIRGVGVSDRLLTYDPERQQFSSWEGLQRVSWTVPANLLALLEDARTNQTPIYHDRLEGGRLVALATNGNLTVYGAHDGAVRQQFPTAMRRSCGWNVSANLRWLAEEVRTSETSSPKTIRLWDLSTMRMVTELRGISGFLGTTSLQLAFSPDHNWLALPDPTHDIVLWNLAEQREERRFKGARWHLNHVQFSVDGKQLAAGGWEGIAYVWNVADGQLAVPPLHGHGSGVMILGFSRDGRTLHTSGSENTIRLWSTATGVEMLRLNQAFIQDALWENDSLLRLTTSEWGTEPVLELVPSFAEIVAAEARVPMLTQP